MLSPALTFAQNKKTGPKTFDLVVGTYTTGKSKGIVVYRFYAETGKLAYLSEIDGVDNPSYLTLSANNKFIYAVNELPKGEVSAFSFEPKTGKMTFINKQSTLGADPCHISVDKDQKNLLIANYSSGNVAVMPLNKDGSIANGIQTVHDDGHSVNKERQESAHAHMAVLTPDEKYVRAPHCSRNTCLCKCYPRRRPETPGVFGRQKNRLPGNRNGIERYCV
jgi:6-phosphogluconolactonase